MAGTPCERVARCHEKARKRRLAIQNASSEQPGTSEQLDPSGQEGACSQPNTPDWLLVGRKRSGGKSLTDFPTEVATSNRRRQLDRIRRRRSFSPSLTTANVACSGAIASTLPLDKTYIESLKESYPERSYYGGPEHECPYCGAVFWFQERVKSASALTQHYVKKLFANQDAGNDGGDGSDG